MPKYADVMLLIAVKALVRIATSWLESESPVREIPKMAARAIVTSPPTTTISPVHERVFCMDASAISTAASSAARVADLGRGGAGAAVGGMADAGGVPGVAEPSGRIGSSSSAMNGSSGALHEIGQVTVGAGQDLRTVAERGTSPSPGSDGGGEECHRTLRALIPDGNPGAPILERCPTGTDRPSDANRPM
jgi:hypothetical protein